MASIAGALLVVAMVLAPRAAVATTPPRFSSERPFSEGNDWEPNVATDPSSSYVYLVTTGLDAKACQRCPEPSILIRASPDAGATWGPVQFVSALQSNNLDSSWQFDPVVRVSNNGTVYVLWLDNWNPGIQLVKSFDHGKTWTRPVFTGTTQSGWSDKPWLAISADGKDVYSAWNHGDPYMSVSHDYGVTFSTPQRLTPPTNKLFYYPEAGVVAPGGTAYFSMSVETAKGSGPVGLVVVRTTDGGLTWNVATVDSSQEAPRCVLSSCITDEFQAQIVLDVDSAGTLMVAYTKNTVADTPKLLYSRTSSDGVTWSAASLINDQGDSGFPTLTHGPTPGDFRVAWQDNRNGPSAWNTYFKRTVDDGLGWSSETLLSDLGSGAPYKSPAGYLFPYGDYFGLAADREGTNFVIWGEGTGRSTTGGSWFAIGG